jgi:hypothetical protein
VKHDTTAEIPIFQGFTVVNTFSTVKDRILTQNLRLVNRLKKHWSYSIIWINIQNVSFADIL